MIRAGLTIAAKDLRERLRDRSALVIAILIPVGLAFILNATIAPAAEGSVTFDFGLSNADDGEVAAAFEAILDGLEADGVVRLARAGPDGARQLAEDGEVAASFLVPAGFSAAVETGRDTEITVVPYPESEIGAGVARALAEEFAAQVNAIQLSVAGVLALEGGAVDPVRVGELVGAAAATADPVRLAPLDVEDAGFDVTTFYAVGIAVFFVFFTVQFGVISLIEERQNGTMIRLVGAPIPRRAIVLGKTMAAFVLGMVSMVAMWLATTFLMGADWGSPAGVLVVTTAGVIAAMGITAIVASLARTAEQAGGYAAIVAVVLGILGGTFFPVSQASGSLALVSYVTPHRWMIEAYRDLSAGGGVPDVLLPVGAILAFGVVTGVIGMALAQRTAVRA